MRIILLMRLVSIRVTFCCCENLTFVLQKKKKKKFHPKRCFPNLGLVHLTILQSNDLLVLLLGDGRQSVQVLQRQLQDNRFLQMPERLRRRQKKQAGSVGLTTRRVA